MVRGGGNPSTRGALEIAIQALTHTRRRVRDSLQHETGLKHPTYSAPDGRQKQILTIDQEAEDACTNFLLKHFGDRDLRVLGEESLWKFPDLDLSKEHIEGYGDDAKVLPGAESRMVAIIDMVDGSDLLERKFGNWCSAAVFFKPNEPAGILFALVHHADGAIYGAHAKGTFLYRPVRGRLKYLGPLGGPQARKLTASNPDKTLTEEIRQITLCFSLRKLDHLTMLPQSFQRWANNTPAADRLRFFDLAGNPMMARLSNGEHVHAVFEHKGQLPHDFVPGAYIGLMAGAHLVNVDGTPITTIDLAKSLMTPSCRGAKYVLACSAELAFNLATALRN